MEQETGTRPLLRTLPNGVRLLALPMPHVRSVSVGVFLRVGSRDETPATNGISHVLEHMAFKGTTTRSVQAINLDAERLGADVNAYTGKDSTGYFMTGLGAHAQQLLGMTADIVLHSTFPEIELQRELEVIRQEAIEYDEDPDDSSNDLLDRALWGTHPMGMPVIGTVENIEGFTRDDLVRHVQQHYVANNTVVVAAGHFDVDALMSRAEDLFTAMPASADSGRSHPPTPAAYAGQAVARRFTQVSQVFLNIAYPLMPMDPDGMPSRRLRLAAAVAANLFGGGMSAPLVDTVRERLGLAYTADANLDSGDNWVNFVVHAVTTPDKIEALVQATGELLHAQTTSIDPVHLERAKNQLTVSYVRASERPFATMERAVEELWASGSVTLLAETTALIDDIRSEEVRDVFARMLAHPPALSITGKGVSAKSARQLAGSLAASALQKPQESMDKFLLQQQVLERLAEDLLQAEQAARAAHETATHEENIAENKYDTLGLEAAYLATGQARRAEAIRQAMANWRQFRPRPYDASEGIQLGALVCLVDSDDKQQQLFLGPDGGSMKLVSGAQLVQVISSEAPLGRALLGKCEGDEVSIQVAPIRQQFEVLRVH